MYHAASRWRQMASAPFIWGGLAAIGFYAAIRQPQLRSDLVIRYLDSHPISRIIVFLFFVGWAAAILKALARAATAASGGRGVARRSKDLSAHRRRGDGNRVQMAR